MSMEISDACSSTLPEKTITGDNTDTSRYDNPTSLMCAAAFGNIHCFSKLTENGVRCDHTDERNRSLLYWAVVGRNMPIIRYLLQKGVTVEDHREVSDESGINTGYSDAMIRTDPYMKAVSMDMVDVVRLLDEHGNKRFQHFGYLRCAVIRSRGKVLKYLLSKYKYPLNHGYIVCDDWHGKKFYTTLLVDACVRSVNRVKLLLEHGADPNQNSGKVRYMYPNAIMAAIMKGEVEMVACLIRSGSYVNSRLGHNGILACPFELSIFLGNIDIAEMLLYYGCSCGVFSIATNHFYKNNVKPELVTLMKNWNVHKNNVIPLKQRCRMAILNHMSPATEEKITKLPLPSILRTYLSILELDDIWMIDAYKRARAGRNNQLQYDVDNVD